MSVEISDEINMCDTCEAPIRWGSRCLECGQDAFSHYRRKAANWDRNKAHVWKERGAWHIALPTGRNHWYISSHAIACSMAHELMESIKQQKAGFAPLHSVRF